MRIVTIGSMNSTMTLICMTSGRSIIWLMLTVPLAPIWFMFMRMLSATKPRRNTQNMKPKAKAKNPITA